MDHRDLLIVLFLCLLAIGWTMLSRDIRVGLPGDVSALSGRPAGAAAASPTAEAPGAWR
jgi:hypothetical protein